MPAQTFWEWTVSDTAKMIFAAIEKKGDCYNQKSFHYNCRCGVAVSASARMKTGTCGWGSHCT